MEQGSLHAVLRVNKTTDTNGDETAASDSRSRARSKRTLQLKKNWGRMNWATSATGATDKAGNPSFIHCQVCKQSRFGSHAWSARESATLARVITFPLALASSTGDSTFARS